MRERVLVARLDSDGDVLLAGPSVRAAAAGRGSGPADVTLLCSPRGEQAARLLPGVADVWTWHCPWLDPEPEPVRPEAMDELVGRVARLRPSVALVLTSFHQSPLPLALLLRLAGVPEIAAVSTDYPGSLLDHRLRPDVDIDEDLPEPERALAVAAAAGFRLPPGDDGRLAVRRPPDVTDLVGRGPYLVLHPGATVPARAWQPERCAEAVRALTAAGHRVVVTGGPRERELTALVAGRDGLDLGGATSLAQLAGVLAGADAVVVGNTGPAHLAAAVGTPVVSLFSPVVPAARWAPYRVPTVLLGDQDAPCRGTRARACPVPGHPCLGSVTAGDVVAAVQRLAKGVAA
ncbi:ADP-heptose:LPS heptosyltransferase [Streptoalloteichus tenebrarius]|uniref:ADP-heptose:LPS heptosyltransferase n=1 Tax=Streptoalloteichus tenebrarius (strain ATCC 17920 / DSM 40477 / JCM 4838 / CBS 697.72 / NBRC 16177 / NCIMB 11028 / NRRL B-12390 / A12253. 1 / ISP 5477) TaxID=1933 RepID=A0ABT1I269_STRSD|nr:glycosyltransferase family 9 protein [Streptoalloteichus tenebrarius]MCP2261835.1 ADP-heptose:LPS heptosyltransferase [Streptoalloteichus tenebrarius]BFE99980.1 glycosyltransferase family 9 protein [Streptoalloteichus tenebrarius]